MESSKDREGQRIIDDLVKNEDDMMCSVCSNKIDFNDNFVFTNDKRLLCRSCFEHSKCN